MDKKMLEDYVLLKGEIKDLRKRIETFKREKGSCIKDYVKVMQKKEDELLLLITETEKYIEEIPVSELRIMFRLYYIDGLTWVQVAHRMNQLFPARRTKYTEDNCWRKNKRFLERVGSSRENRT